MSKRPILRPRNIEPLLEYQYQGLVDLTNLVKTMFDYKLKLIEIGSYAGESTQIFIDSDMFEEIVCVDAWLNGYNDGSSISDCFPMKKIERYFTKKVALKNKDIIIKKKGNSDDVCLKLEDNKYDMVYIDGGHTYEQVKKDIVNYLPKIKIGGIISGHDYSPEGWVGVVKAINEVLGEPNYIFKDNSWMFIKK